MEKGGCGANIHLHPSCPCVSGCKDAFSCMGVLLDAPSLTLFSFTLVR